MVKRSRFSEYKHRYPNYHNADWGRLPYGEPRDGGDMEPLDRPRNEKPWSS